MRNALIFSLTFLLLAGCDSKAPVTTSSESASSRSGGAVFTDVTVESGIDFVATNGAAGQWRNIECMTSGGGFLDYDSDGDLDIFFTQANRSGEPFGSDFDPQLTSRLYRNDGNGKFTDVTRETGTGIVAYAMGCAAADYDRDGDPDIYITCVGQDILLENDNGKFVDVSKEAGILLSPKEVLFSSSAAWVDYDRDGYLDLYVARYCIDWEHHAPCQRAARVAPEYCGPKSYLKASDKLFHNNGDGTFTDASARCGIDQVAGYSFAMLISDLTGDGWLDIYVACDQSPGQLWVNDTRGGFEDRAKMRGAAFNSKGVAIAGMGTVAEDFDSDGDFDLFITNIRKRSNLFLRNDNGFFTDASLRWGERAWLEPYTGFGVITFDQDHDGRLDMYVANGAVEQPDNPPDPDKPYDEASIFLRQGEDGRFRLANHELDPEIVDPALSRGIAYADYDNDGDIDVLIFRSNERPQLLRNDAATGNWIMFETYDAEGLSPYLNARITIEVAGGKQIRELRPYVSYLVTVDPRVHFGIGNATKVDKVTVQWASGATQTWTDLDANKVHKLRETTP